MFCNFRFELRTGIFWFFLKQIVLKSDFFFWQDHEQRLPRSRCWWEGAHCMAYFQGLHPTTSFSGIWFSRSLQSWWGNALLDLVGCCPIVAGCEGAPITIQTLRPPKYRSAADAILCLRVLLLCYSYPISETYYMSLVSVSSGGFRGGVRGVRTP